MSVPPATPKSVRIATYNLENMGNGKSEESMAHLASTLKSLNADVVGIQEEKSLATLDQFLQNHGLAETYPYRAVFAVPGSTQNVGILSRFEISHQASNHDRGPFVRDLGGAQIEIPGYPMRLYVGHLKADPFYMGRHTPQDYEKARARRQGEVEGIEHVLAEDMSGIPAHHYVVMMDGNAVPESKEMQTLVDPHASVPFVDPLTAQTGPESISHPPTGHRYDYIMLSPEMAKDVVPGSAHVYRENPESLQASDHLPVVMDLRIAS